MRSMICFLALAWLRSPVSGSWEAVRQEAQQKLRTLYDRQSLFERRLLRSFPTMRSIHYPEAMKKWKEYLESRKK